MKVLVTGASGQLGHDVVQILTRNNIINRGISSKDLDLTIRDHVYAFVREYSPDVVIHCAAYTAVDKAELEADKCYNINVNGTRYLAEVCKELQSVMVYISSDYVFPGAGEKPYEEDDLPGPINVYGKTKLQGEREVKDLLSDYFIVRTSWLFGVNGHNFVKTMMLLGNQKDCINVVYDQIGSPTYTVDLAERLVQIIKTNHYGTYHLANEGYCSWAQFAEEIFRKTLMICKVNPITSEEFPAIASRPKNSRLSCKKQERLGFNRLPTWENALHRYILETL